MLLSDLKIQFLTTLFEVNDVEENQSMFYLVLKKIHNLARIDLALNPRLEATKPEVSQWLEIIKLLKLNHPIQYILGETEFYGLRFLVNQNTLIPRQETEELVDLIVFDCNKVNRTKPAVLDIGSGSGCIAISLAKTISDSKVFALDISGQALETAKQNAVANRVAIHFIQNNILQTNDVLDLECDGKKINARFDIIVSNPPYVRNLEKSEIKPNVLEYEPHLALFVEDTDALLFYRKIGKLAFKNLKENGALYFEINQYLGDQTKQLLQDIGFKTVEVFKDIYGNNRMIRCLLD